jgi:signal transduction histidine kinase
MKISMLLVPGNDKRADAAAIEAMGATFPGASVVRVASLKEALGREAAADPELLVLADADDARTREAAQAVDGERLPRWAVVACGDFGPVPFAEVIPAAEWTPALLAPVFRGSVPLHTMHRERERLRGDLLSLGIRVTHDLRTPVGGIISATEVLDVSMTSRPQAERSLTQPIFESANDLVKVIGQLSLVSKASARPVSRQQFSMALPVSRALERVEMKVRQKGAAVSNAGSWPEANADPNLVEAVWAAFLENAIRHSGASPRIELGWDQTGESSRFWVRDAGPGVPAEKRRFLFQPFNRMHEPSAPRGLGLSIVERLVKLQGGQCGYEPGVPTGACFFFTLPP